MTVLITPADLLHVPGTTHAECRDSVWFADVWASHCRPGMHLRAIHYRLISVGTVLMAPGVRPHTGRGRPAADDRLDAIRLPYENSFFCWSYLQKAALAARYWRLVDARSFEEHRSPEPEINITERDTPTPAIMLPDEWPDDTEFPAPTITGYDYRDADQGQRVHLWIEKSTMDDVLAPLCRDLGVTYQSLTGYFSVTRAVEMLCRLRKPTIVFYVSDLDAAGCQMPIAFGEALTHYAPIYAPHVDIKLKQIALTEEQVLHYQLPRNVIDAEKESPYNRQFRREHPLGPCELDALEAIRPGSLAKIVRAAVAPYFDNSLYLRLSDAQRAAQRIVNAEWAAETAEARGALAIIERDLQTIHARRDAELAPLRQAIDVIKTRFDVELEPHEIRRADVRQTVLDIDHLEIALPARPEPHVSVTDTDWLCELSATPIEVAP